jgi:FKBP-type peptidyl-prolyl cis-trans isomerase SlyD
MESPQITNGMVVQFHYVLSDASGVVLDNSHERGEPMLYLHGAGNILVGLERALEGACVGDQLRVEVPPELGYGVRKGDPLSVPRSVFPDDAELVVGGSFTTETKEGRPLLLWITRIKGDQVWVDPHHPLAGKTLHYLADVLMVRPASARELRERQPFGEVVFDL